jgi:hypothetical protein
LQQLAGAAGAATPPWRCARARAWGASPAPPPSTTITTSRDGVTIDVLVLQVKQIETVDEKKPAQEPALFTAF